MTTTARRVTFATLVLLTITGLIGLILWAFSAEGFLWYEWIMIACFIVTLPWTAIGFWNAVIGFCLMRFAKEPAAHVFPALAKAHLDAPITSKTALAVCIRNENVSDVDRNLTVMIARLVASGEAKNFHVFVLSDSNDPEIIARENTVFAQLKRSWAGKIGITYRLRTDNWGFKAGNLREFCERYGDDYDFMLTLDADSVMTASAILRMVRVMQQNENLGILQSLVVGLPADSAFTRAFQFGMRLGMRSFTLGSAWWQADCGPYWGHNALIRVKPFRDHCHLPVLPGTGALSGYVLSHDQVEATFMRRAGYECRVIADENGSFEENPPHLLEFIRRDLRWCHGNMQYLKLLREPGLLFMSRVQLFLAILMFVGSPAWMLFVFCATASIVFTDITFKGFDLEPGFALFGIIMTMIFAPKIVSIIDVLMRRDLRQSFGGGVAVAFGAVTEIAFSMVLAPIMAVAETLFLLALPFGKVKTWAAQNRSSHALPLIPTTRQLWPQMTFGFVGVGALVATGSVDTVGFLVSLPVFFGPVLAIPFALSSSHLAAGHLATRLGLWQIPEENRLPVIIRALDLPAVSIRGKAVTDGTRHEPLTTDQLLEPGLDKEDRLVA
ncbi:MAG: glucans biosynthesis glucosyltransferase MdoH [Pseudomonadota bacterium]